MLGFDVIEVYYDQTRDQILSKLADLSAEAEAFEKDHADQTIFALAFVWIGLKLSNYCHKQMIKQKIGEAQFKAVDAQQFLLTSTGDILGHIEFLEKIARRSGIQIAVFDDFDGVACA